MRQTHPSDGAGRRNADLCTLLALVLVAVALALAPWTSAVAATAPEPALAFPGAQGWAAHTPGGRGGKIVRVTTLAAEGPGSFTEAVNTKGPRCWRASRTDPLLAVVRE